MQINNQNEDRIRNKGVITGIVTARAIKYAGRKLSSELIGNIDKKLSQLPAADSLQLKNAMNTAAEQAGISSKGINVVYIKERPQLSISEKIKTVTSAFRNGKIKGFKDFFNTINSLYQFDSEEKATLDLITNAEQRSTSYKRITSITKPLLGIDNEIAIHSAKKRLSEIQAGKNAFINIGAKRIVLPEKSLHPAVFHEMGHYLNILKPTTKQIAILSHKLRNFPFAVLLIALLNKRKVENKKPKDNPERNILQKAHDGIKKHAGLIASISMLPLIVNEAMASINGQKLAKNLISQGKLSPQIYKKIKLTNAFGLTSYIAAAVITGTATNFAIKLKDKIQAKYEKKLNDTNKIIR